MFSLLVHREVGFIVPLCAGLPSDGMFVTLIIKLLQNTRLLAFYKFCIIKYSDYCMFLCHCDAGIRCLLNVMVQVPASGESSGSSQHRSVLPESYTAPFCRLSGVKQPLILQLLSALWF